MYCSGNNVVGFDIQATLIKDDLKFAKGPISALQQLQHANGVALCDCSSMQMARKVFTTKRAPLWRKRVFY